LRPRRQILATDRAIGRALQHRDAVEVVGRHRDRAVVHADPALADEETRYALPLRQVLGVVPVVELVFGGPPDLHRRDQRALRHHSALLDRHAPVDALFLRWIVARRLVIRAAVVPDDDVALPPAVTVFALRLDHALRQLVDHRVALVLVDSLDPQDLAGIEVEAFAPGLRVRADDRVEDGCPVAVLGIEQRLRLPAAAVREGADASLETLFQSRRERVVRG